MCIRDSPYILAYTFTGLFDTFGTANNLVRDIFNLGRDFTLFPKVRNVPGAIIVFSFTLYPYVYLVSRMAFINQSRSIIEAGRTLGLNKTQVYYKLGIPMIRRPPRSTLSSSSAASDVYKRQEYIPN